MRRRLLIIASVLTGILVVVLLSWASRATPFVRDRVVSALNARFESQVNLESLQVSVFPRPEVYGTGLTLRHEGRTDVPPLITIDGFQSGASVVGLIGTPFHLRNVSLEGLTIRIPPGGVNGGNDDDDAAANAGEADAPGGGTSSAVNSILIDSIESRQARLEIASSTPGRLPRVFDINDLYMQNFGPDEGATFQAGLINPMPRGRIETSGTFGPWNAPRPERTAVGGEYTFSNANLDDIKGIGGTLSSVGSYSGVLQRIEVNGQTETPDFSIDVGGHPVPLSTTFKAVVDGTNGDTFLERVEAKLAESPIVAVGSVVRTEDIKGRRVELDVTIEQGRLEDLMRLAVRADKPPIVGRIDLQTKFLLPAGEAGVVDRLQLDGRFNLGQAEFTNFEVQKRVTELSQRGRGDEESDGTGERIVSNLRGTFRLRDGMLRFSELMFAVPGAVVQLAGDYDLHEETLNFKGHLLADASLADMTSGIKSLLARLAQPFFRRKGGGSRIPIKVTGTREKPSFGLDVGGVFGRD